MTDASAGEAAEGGADAAPEAVRKPWTRPRFSSAWSTLALAMSLALAAASLAAEPPKKEEVVTLAPESASSDTGASDGSATDPGATAEGPTDAAAAATSGSGGAKGTGTAQKRTTTAAGAAAAGATTKSGLQCAAGRNGGATDVGVTGSEIKLGSTVVQSGAGASFLGDVRFAMESIKDKTNAAGGICGRQLKLVLKDDGWDPQRGAEYIRNLVEDEKVFALAVVPSSEGLKQASDGGYFREKKVPVVGSDGMLIHQYLDPYIWPVAASTMSTMHIMVKQAYDTGTRNFGLVYESDYHFGIEGAYAFNAAVKRVTNSDVPGYANPLAGPSTCKERFCGIDSRATAYDGPIQTFTKGCQATATAGACDFMALLLEPTTALKWMKGGNWAQFPRIGGPQPLFTYNFGNDCGSRCDGMWLWTGYLPPLGDFLSRPAVATYVEDVKAASSSADSSNSFVEGGYVGMRLVVESLKKTGPNLTREGLKQTLDSMTFDSGLAPPLTWKAGAHYANTRMRAFSIQYKSGFSGWRDEQVDMVDPWVGQDTGI